VDGFIPPHFAAQELGLFGERSISGATRPGERDRQRFEVLDASARSRLWNDRSGDFAAMVSYIPTYLGVHGELLIKRRSVCGIGHDNVLARRIAAIGGSGSRTATLFGRSVPWQCAADAHGIVVDGELTELAPL
jgi:hypothetical protein